MSRAAVDDVDLLAIKTLKFLAIDAIEAANSGHPGLPLGAADLTWLLFSRFLRHNPKDPHWIDRDRFLLSPGHGSMLLYAMLHLAGYDLSLDELKRFRQWGSKTPGHPEVHLTPGVEVTTGPLGQGFANAVGMALASKMADARFSGLFNHRIWAIVSDGDVMEGIAYEAASMAGHLGLGNLTLIYDDNKITLDGAIDEAFSEDVARRFEACGWRTLSIDGHNHAQILAAYELAASTHDKPTLILARTVIGQGAPTKAGSHKVHGEPLGKNETLAMRRALGWPEDATFVVPEAVRARAEALAASRTAAYDAWQGHCLSWRAAHPAEGAQLDAMLRREVPDALLDQCVAAAPSQTDATRSLGGAIEQRIAALMPSLVGGDADLGGSTKTVIAGSAKVLRGHFEGRNLRFGIREHAMGAVANGMALYGMFIPFTATFLTFSDYMRPAIRLAALSELPVVHVFTHDSIFLGEDGPTHQSIEHVAALRLIPNVHVWRPADAIECAAAWASAAARRDGPSELIFSRQKVDALPGGAERAALAARGGYVLSHEPDGRAPDLVIIATGSEVGLALEAARALSANGRAVRVVSMPCVERFAAQDDAYQHAVLPAEGRRVSIEAGRTDLWHRWVGRDGLALGVDRFGASAPARVLAEKYGLTAPQIVARITDWLNTPSR